MPSPAIPPKKKSARAVKMGKNAPVAPQAAPAKLRGVARPNSPNGIRELVWVNASDLEARLNPANWKRHPPRQVKALQASLNANGWAGAALYNETTGKLLDGHCRQAAGGIVPVLVGSWTPEQERSLLLTLDPLAAMSETDTASLHNLLGQVDTDLAALDSLDKDSKATLSRLSAELSEAAELIEFGDNPSFFPDLLEDQTDGIQSAPTKPNKDGNRRRSNPTEDQDEETTGGMDGREHSSPYDASTETEGITKFKDREEIALADWNLVGSFDFPSLLSEKLASVPQPLTSWVPSEKKMPAKGAVLYIWGTGTIGLSMARALVSFYTDDRRFEHCWNNPAEFASRISNLEPLALLTPNFSIWEGCSRAEEIYQIFRMRFVARYWQEAGFNIIPDIQLGNLFGDAWDWRLLGIPKGLPSIAVNLQTPGQTEVKQFFNSRKQRLLSVLKLLQPKQCLIYHGTRFPKDFLKGFPSSVEPICLMSHMGRLLENKKKPATTS